MRRDVLEFTLCACLECYRQEALDADHKNRNAEESESGSVGSAVFCLDCGLSTAYFLSLAHTSRTRRRS